MWKSPGTGWFKTELRESKSYRMPAHAAGGNGYILISWCPLAGENSEIESQDKAFATSHATGAKLIIGP